MTRTGTRGMMLMVLTVTAMAACAPTDDDANSDEVEGSAAEALTVSTVRDLAPLVYLHPDERHLPMSAATFLRHARLRWSHDQGCGDHQLADVGQVRDALLGGGGYRHQLARRVTLLRCADEGRTVSSSEHTRPRDGVAGNEGFFLDLDNAYRGGEGPTAPSYYEYQRGRFVTYWFFYGNSHLAVRGGDLVAHEGDWERISIHLDAQDRPTEVAFWAHSGSRVVPWSQVRRRGTHPIVFSASESHASYPAAGSHDIGWGLRDITATGAAWPTWNNLVNVRDRGWYGFGGAWGEVGNISDTTGPLGPSRYKCASVAAWAGCN